MQLFYTPDIASEQYTLSEEESRHCVRVLRMQAGDRISLTDGRGTLYSTEITDANPKHCTVRVLSAEHEYGRRPYTLTMGVAPTKNIDRFEWFLEKATEIGVDRIVPILCDHSERRTLKSDRAIKVITSAVKQSLKAYHPQLDELTPVRELISCPFSGSRLFAYCHDLENERVRFRDCIVPGEATLILIGPEGDFSTEEINFALANGYRPVTLGTSRLRTETAALVAVADVALLNE